MLLILRGFFYAKLYTDSRSCQEYVPAYSLFFSPYVSQWFALPLVLRRKLFYLSHTQMAAFFRIKFLTIHLS